MMPSDPRPYDGPIERADGQRPFNHYLWPTECWLAQNEPLFRRVPYDFRIAIIELANGSFSISGNVSEIEHGRYWAGLNDYTGRRCVFDNRASAIRSSGYELITLARRCIRDDRWASPRGRDCRHLMPDVINWARRIVALETGKLAQRPRAIKLPTPPVQPTGLALFDHEWGAMTT